MGPNNSGIVTLVERQTRFVLIGKLPGCRDSQTVIDVLAGMIQELPAQLRKGSDPGLLSQRHRFQLHQQLGTYPNPGSTQYQAETDSGFLDPA